MEKRTKKLIVLLVLVIGIGILVLRVPHYISQRKKTSHDSYMIVKQDCKDGKIKYTKCPDMEMFGFKFSAIIILLVSILTISLVNFF